jgi:hypothetical protein
MQRGDILDQDQYYTSSQLSPDEQVDFIRRCHAHLRWVVQVVVGTHDARPGVD